jgi:DNA recombination-dependent growth factor C
MKPVDFEQTNAVLGKYQPQYQALPVHRTHDGEVISCWSLTWRERLAVLFTGRLWLRQLTFRDPLQPQRPQVESPFATR